jgi:transcriptional regulator with XRE-family HTH domain
MPPTPTSEQYRKDSRHFASVRRAAGVSLRQVASETGEGLSTVWRFERGLGVSAMAYVRLMEWARAAAGTFS